MAESQSNRRESQTARYRRLKNTPEWAAKFAWNRITSRLSAAKTRHHFRAYLGVELRMTRDEFLAWAIPQYKAWFRDHPGKTPSLDRIQSEGHYEIGNLQIIAAPENNSKTLRNKHLDTPEGMKYCGRCKQLLPFASFKPVKPGGNGTFGLYGWCIECTRANDRERSKRRYIKRRK